MSQARARLTTNIVGGLGNQLFLIANLLATARRNHIPAVLERVPWSSSHGPPRPTYWSSIFENLAQFGVADRGSVALRDVAGSSSRAAEVEVTVPEMRPVAPIVLDPTRPCLYNMIGFFQSVVYFADEPVIRQVVPESLWRAAAQHMTRNYAAVDNLDTHLVGLHARRGDYATMRDTFEMLDASYYDAALRLLLGRQLLNPCAAEPRASDGRRIQILVFCEDVDFGKLLVGYLRSKYASLSVRLVCASMEQAPLTCDPRQPREVVELLMLAQCADVVMANSTFSWWAAYLNEQPLRRVVAPSRWFVQNPYPSSTHLYCDDWIIL